MSIDPKFWRRGIQPLELEYCGRCGHSELVHRLHTGGDCRQCSCYQPIFSYCFAARAYDGPVNHSWFRYNGNCYQCDWCGMGIRADLLDEYRYESPYGK